MKILGVITARAGSLRMPNKNTALLGKKPLVAWSIHVGQETCDKVVVSTNSVQVAHVAAGYGCEVVVRPEDISKGQPGMQTKAVLHALDNAGGGPYDAVLLLQPTSPFRTTFDVRRSIDAMLERGAESVVSVIPFPLEDALFKIGGSGRLLAAAGEQDLIYTPNGAIFLARTHVLRQDPPRGGWYGPHLYPYVMPPERSLDIDTHADFEAAQAMLDDDGNFAMAG